MNRKTLSLWVAMLCLVGFAIYYSETKEQQSEANDPLAIVSSDRRIRGNSKEESRKQLVARLPKKIHSSLGFMGRPLTDEGRNIMNDFQKLGSIDGGEAIDVVLGLYGEPFSLGVSGDQLNLPNALAYTFSGWLEKDLDGALAAFGEFVTVSNATSNSVDDMVRRLQKGYFSWKGENYGRRTRCGFDYEVDQMIQTVLEKATSLDPEATRKFIEKSNYSGRTESAALTAYAEGLIMRSANSVDWLEVADKVREIATHRGHDGSRITDTNLIIAREWAGESPESAVNWLVDEYGLNLQNRKDAETIGRTLAQVSPDSRSLVFDWIEDQRSEAAWNDELIRGYWFVMADHSNSLNSNIDRLMNLIPEENHRREIVSRFTRTTNVGDVNYLRFTKNELRELVESANLSNISTAEQNERINAGVESNGW